MTAIRSPQFCRRGAAQVEFLMAFPFLIGLFGVVFPLVSTSMTRLTNTEAVRTKAFDGRHKPWEPGAFSLGNVSNGMESIATMLGPNPLIEPAWSLSSSEYESEVDPIMTFYSSYIDGKPIDEAFVLAGSWDHKEIQFDEHGRLVLPKHSTYFGMTGSLSGFDVLNTFQGAATSQFNQLTQQYGLDGLLGGGPQSTAQLNQAVNQAIQATNAEIAEAQRQLSQLTNRQGDRSGDKSRIENQLAADPGNEQLQQELREIDQSLDRVRDEIASATRKLEKLREALDRLRQWIPL